jgi:Brp/Blh family beta-carotene 15,15'-monooxygenase
MRKRAEDWLAVHRRVACGATAVSIAPLFYCCKDLNCQVLFFIGNVLLFGVCHGSLDHLQCPPDKNGKVGVLRFLLFLFIYLALAVIVLYVWFHEPGPMLVGFLTFSCLHFILDEDQILPFWQKLLLGSLPVLAPCFLHVQAVSEIFSFLVNSQTSFSAQMMSILKALGFLAIGLASASLLVSFCGAIERRSVKGGLAVLPGVLLLIAYVSLPPLLSFTIYFCWWHSMRKCILLVDKFQTKDFLSGLVNFVKSAALITLGSWLFALIIFFMMPSKGVGELAAQQIRTIFYLLSALTVPHMFLSMFEQSARSTKPLLSIPAKI